MSGPATGSLFRSGGERGPHLSQQIGVVEYSVDTPASSALYTSAQEWLGPNGAIFFRAFISELVSVATGGPTFTTTSKIPAGTTRVTTATRVTTTLAGNSVSTYELGISGTLAKFQGTTTNITAGDTNCGSCQGDGSTPYATDTAMVMTLDQTTTAGAIRIVAMCEGVRPPTA